MSTEKPVPREAFIGGGLGILIALAFIAYIVTIERSREELHRQFAHEIYACVAASGARYDDCAKATVILMESRSKDGLQ